MQEVLGVTSKDTWQLSPVVVISQRQAVVIANLTCDLWPSKCPGNRHLWKSFVLSPFTCLLSIYTPTSIWSFCYSSSLTSDGRWVGLHFRDTSIFQLFSSSLVSYWQNLWLLLGWIWTGSWLSRHPNIIPMTCTSGIKPFSMFSKNLILKCLEFESWLELYS